MLFEALAIGGLIYLLKMYSHKDTTKGGKQEEYSYDSIDPHRFRTNHDIGGYHNDKIQGQTPHEIANNIVNSSAHEYSQLPNLKTEDGLYISSDYKHANPETINYDPWSLYFF